MMPGLAFWHGGWLPIRLMMRHPAALEITAAAAIGSRPLPVRRLRPFLQARAPVLAVDWRAM
jgi:hypothetical protein